MYLREYERSRLLVDVNFKLGKVIRTRLAMAIRNKQRVGSAVRDLGMTIEQFRWYLEGMFEPGMTWDNHGKWHLDHIRPLSSFDLTDREQFLEACNWQNYQPLWATDNLRKHAKFVKQINK